MIRVLFCFCVLILSGASATAQKKQKNKDYRKENFKETGRPGDNYTYSIGGSYFNPETGKYEQKPGEWKKQPEQYSYDPKEFKKPKHKNKVYGGNPIKRLFKIKPRSPKPGSSPEEKKDAPYTTGEEKK